MLGLITLALAAVLAGAGPESALDRALEGIKPDQILAHIKVLASDEFEGRGPGTAGETKTVAYLTDQFRRMRLKPGNPDRTYVQDVPLVGFRATEVKGSVTTPGGPIALSFPDDFVAVSRRMEKTVAVEGSDVVFVGYGVVAPEYGWDDYKGLDVRGKTLLMLVNDPPVPDPKDPAKLDPAVFKGRAMTYYGRWTYKYEIASEKGAAAAILIHETGPAGYPFEVVRGSWSRENFDTARTGGAGRGPERVAVEGWITDAKARDLLRASGRDLDALKKDAVKRDFRPVPLGCSARFAIKNELREVKSKNVVARLEGSDPALKDELLVYSAHWDHLGKDPARKGDQIFNGAADNASGVAAVLEIARAFTRITPAPKRSILFLATAAEEQGLLGAKHYAEHPLYPLERTLANINLDVINLWGPTTDIVSIGMGQTDLEDRLVEIAGRRGRTVVPDADPEKGYYYRSDHFEFAKRGVPALDPKGGQWYEGKPLEFGKQKRDEYTEKHYHKPSDEVRPDWDLSGAVADMKLLVELGYRVAEESRYPEWKPGSEFRRGARRCSGPPSHDPAIRHDRAWSTVRRGISVMSQSPARSIAVALAVGGGAVVGAWLDSRYGWVTPAFDFIAHQFYEVPIVAAVRRPSQLVLTRWHLAVLAAYLTTALAVAPWISRHARAWLAVFGLGYAIRAIIWICGGNLPLVPGDSSHYLEVATSVLRGEGPVMHYVHSFFRDYTGILEGRGVLSDWDTPLDAYVRAGAFRIAGLGPDSSLEARIVVSKACSFLLNLAALPGLYVFARRRYDGRIALWAMAVLAVLPVHALYAGFILRESLVALLAILAVWMLSEVWHARPGRPAFVWAVAAGLCGGLAALSRMTSLALLGAAVLFMLASPQPEAARPPRRLGRHLRRRLPPLGVDDLAGVWIALLFGDSLFRIQLLLGGPPLRSGEHAPVAVLHAGEPSRDRPRQAEVAVHRPHLFDDDRRPAAGPRLLPTARHAGQAGPRHRPARRDHLRGLPSGDAQEYRRRDPGHAARSLLHAGLRADVARRRRRGHRVGGVAGRQTGRHPLAGRDLRRAGLGRPHLVLRRHMVCQAVPTALAGPSRNRRVDPGSPEAGPPRRPDHDLVPVGAAGDERPDHDPHASQLPAAADQRGDPPIRGHAFPLGFVRASAV